MTVIKRILLTVFLAVTGLSLSAQEKPDSTAYRFRFVAENDMFFSPWSGNGQELERLLAAIDEHRPAIEAGQMYLLVTSTLRTATKNRLRRKWQRHAAIV